MAISKEEVKHIALLSRLALSEMEIEKFTHDLSEILEYSQKISELDTSDVPPTSHAIAFSNIYREDEVKPSLSNEEALANAPDKEGSYFKVPRVID